jgi:hypothetical protein
MRLPDEERERERLRGEGGGMKGLGIYGLFEEDLRGLDVLRGLEVLSGLEFLRGLEVAREFPSTEAEKVIVLFLFLGGRGGGMSRSADCLISFVDFVTPEALNVLRGVGALVFVCLVLMLWRVLALNRLGKGGGKSD